MLAWSEKSRTAYIAPMEIILDDIARTLGARHVTLPGSESVPPQPLFLKSTTASNAAATASDYPLNLPSRPPPTLTMARDQLPPELEKLQMGSMPRAITKYTALGI